MQRIERPVHELEERLPPVLSNRTFRLIWLAQIISQTAQNAILYALIVVVLKRTDSTTSTSGIVLAFVAPTIAFGLFSGLLVDRGNKRHLLFIANVGRAVCAIVFIFARDYVWALYGITIFFASFSQLFTTTTATSIPLLVNRQQLISANSLFSGAFTIAQIAGLIVLSPIILRTAGEPALFIIAAAAFLIAVLLTRLLPFIGGEGEVEADSSFPRVEELRGAVRQFREALKSLSGDPMSTLALVHITFSSTLILIFAIMVPLYMQAVLDVGAEDAVTIFAPVAIGALFGLRAVPWIVARLGKTRTVALGMFGIAFCLGVLGFVERIASLLERVDPINPFGEGIDRVFGLSILVALTMLFAGPMGFCYALLNTPAQTTLHERTPAAMRGRVIAAQMVLANGVALIPLVVVGTIADLYGVSSVVLAIAGLVAVAGGVSIYLDQRWLGREGSGPPQSGGEHPRVTSAAASGTSLD